MGEPVQLSPRQVLDAIQVVGADVDLQSGDRFDAVRCGSITLKARMKPARIEPGSNPGIGHLVNSAGEQLGLCYFDTNNVPDHVHDNVSLYPRSLVLRCLLVS